ncbi:MAG TPA: DUF4159 domain-containing protein, partial [Rhizomicrobium sp.]|nr:DUF4159 domain-containing protein [Rhizomicrobium sp.]
MNLFASLSFGAPWILAALVILPAIYWLLRVTPPSPKRVVFPPLRLLLGLTGKEETPARTPLWLLLLRLLAAALIIVALAQPTIGQPPKMAGTGPLVLFVDNGWTAAHAWDARQAAISDALASANRAGRAVAIIPTASAQSPDTSLLDAGAAERVARELAPQPWMPDRARVLKALAKAKFPSRPEILWLSDGVDQNDARATADALSKIGEVRIYSDAAGKGPLALKPPGTSANGFTLSVLRADSRGDASGEIDAVDAHGANLAAARFHFNDGKAVADAKLALPLEVRNETARLEIAGQNSAGGVQLLDSSAKRRAVGLVSASNMEEEQPLLSDLFYLERALQPYADLQKGTITNALSHGVSVLLLSDIGKISGADRERVAKFVSDGGVLIRFAGARMTQGVDDLVPVKLRSGGRTLGSALSWSSPQHLAAFPDNSPFHGLAVPHEVTVSRQILAEPSVELSNLTWARLADGTPLVTAEQRGKGWIVLFHVTASPAWSSLPLSGLYVDMLRRVIDLSSGTRPADLGAAATVYPPYETLDGFGRTRKPPTEALPLRGAELAKAMPSPAHPPGLYGSEGSQVALNAVDARTLLLPLRGVSVQPYSGSASMALEYWLLAAAILLLLADSIISLVLRGHLTMPRRLLGGAGALLLGIALLHPNIARADDAFDMKAALDTRLAYVVTGLPDVDAMSKAGLTGLGLVLKTRTTYEPQEPVGVNLETDNLAFFPLLYWPMDPREKDLSPKALAKIGEYMRNGGTVVFDTRDLTLGAERGPNSPGEQTLRRLVSKLDLPPLQPIPSDHVLTKAFYLLQDFPGRWDGGKVWVEALPPPDPDAGPAPARGGDGVSPVIIGSNDWAAAWAVDDQGRPLVACVPGGDQQHEMAMRFGV